MWPQAIAAVIFARASVLRRTFLPAVPRSRAAAWREAAAAAGLTRVEVTPQGLTARKGGLHVHLTHFDRRDAQGTQVRVDGPALARTLTLRSEGLDSAWRRRRGWQEIEIGDADFDRAVWVEGPPLVVRAILDPDTRAAVLALLEGRLVRPRLQPFWANGRIEEGALTIELPEARAPVDQTNVFFEFALAGGGHFADALRAVIALAERLATPSDVPRRIAEALRTEPIAAVRERCLTTLLRELPEHPATREALLAAREDPEAAVRLRAGIALGPEGRHVLLRLALGEGAEDATTEQAVAALAARLTVEEATAILRSALR